MQIKVGNFADRPLSGWAVQFNKNPFGLAPTGMLQLPEVAPNGGTAQTLLNMAPNSQSQLSGQPPANPLYLEVAIKTNLDIFYLSIGYDLSAVLMDGGPVAQAAFQQTWQQVPAEKKARVLGQFGQGITPEMLIPRMRQYYVYFVTQMASPSADVLYFSASTTNRITIFCELSLQRGATGVQLVCCSDAPPIVPIFQSFLQEVLRVRWQGGPPA